jgi:microsomal dipeptidase-like Zn-dependent dipeptidase
MTFASGRLTLALLLTMATLLAQQRDPWKAPPPLPPRALPPPPNDYNFVHPPTVTCGDETADLSYKVPLTPQEEKRALAIYRKSFVILAHTHCVEESDFEEMRKAGVTAAVLKIDVDGMNFVNGTRAENLPNENWLARGERETRRIVDLAARPGSGMLIVRSIRDLRRAKREEMLGIILSFEGAKPLVGKLENLQHFYDLDLRDLQLWWATPNELKTADHRRLSPFGEDVVRQANRLGVEIDLSHMTSQAFAQSLEVGTEPVLISHCSVAGVDGDHDQALSGTDHLSDGAIWAMAKNGGVICLHFVTPDYIRPHHGTQQATVADWVDHAAYIRDLVGVNYIALGPDYFPERGWHWIEGAGQVSLMPNIARELVRRGFTDDEISKILGGNLMRVYEKSWQSR